MDFNFCGTLKRSTISMACFRYAAFQRVRFSNPPVRMKLHSKIVISYVIVL